MEPWTQRGLTDSSWEKGEGSRERKKNTGKENKKKLCGIHNSSPEMNGFVFIFCFQLCAETDEQKVLHAYADSVFVSIHR